jgi:hypothetical protein
LYYAAKKDLAMVCISFIHPTFAISFNPCDFVDYSQEGERKGRKGKNEGGREGSRSRT